MSIALSPAVTELMLDPMNAANQWTALESDGLTPSVALVPQNDTGVYRFGSDSTSLRVTGSTSAEGHVLRRTLADVDLSALDEIRVSLRSTRVADGSSRPFFLELRLGSNAMPLNDAANTWHRYFPVPRAGNWDLVRLRITDLAPQVRSALSVIQVRCIDATESFTVHLDDLLAVRERLVADVDAALLSKLHQRAAIDGTPVPAIIHHPEDDAPAPSVPFIRITPFAIEPAAERLTSFEQRTDFTSQGCLVRPGSLRYDMFFELDVFTETRDQKAGLLEFLASTLTPNGILVQNGVEIPMEWITVAPQDRIGGSRSDRSPLHIKVRSRRELGEPRVVRRTEEVLLDVEQRARRAAATGIPGGPN